MGRISVSMCCFCYTRLTYTFVFLLQLQKSEGLQLTELSAYSGGTIWNERILVTFASLTPFRQNEDNHSGNILCSLSGPISGCFVTEWTEDMES